VTFTNTADAPAAGVKLSISLPGSQWSSFVSGTTNTSKTFTEPVASGASVSAIFKVTSGPVAFNGDLIGNASWTNLVSGGKHTAIAVEKVRNVSPVKINEFRVGTSSPTNSTNSFIELYNAGSSEVDISNWTLTEHPTQQAIFSSVNVPAGTKLAAGGFYLLGLSNSGLAVSARAGDAILHVSTTAGMTAGDRIDIDTGSNLETRKIAKIGTAASVSTTLWQPVPEGPVITIPAGSTNVPVTSTAGFVVGEKIALGYGATYPAVAKAIERYEVATVTAIGKPGTQAFLGVDARAGSTNIQVTSVSNISVGDKIRLDIDSTGHGIETVTVAKVGTQANRTTLSVNATAGATNIKVRTVNGFAVGDRVIIGTPANQKTYTITAVGKQGQNGTGIDIMPAFAEAHSSGEDVVKPGTGLDLAAPLRFNHAANLPFDNRGTGISFEQATAYDHSSNEPVQALGTGITLDSPLTQNHAIDAVVRDDKVTTAGYQGSPEPNQWFGGPVLFSNDVVFGNNTRPLTAGSMVLRDANGLVVDSLNYGLLVDPWIAEGYQAASGSTQSGCRVIAPGSASGAGTSAGRFPDGLDNDSNCMDFISEPATALSAASDKGATNLKVASVAGFDAGQTISVDTGTNTESAVIAAVGTPGATALGVATQAGATVISVASVTGFSFGQAITIGSGSNTESATVVSANRFAATITVEKPLTLSHAMGVPVAGTGITLTQALTRAHASTAQVSGGAASPGAANLAYRRHL